MVVPVPDVLRASSRSDWVTTYADADMRVARGAGSMFLFERMHGSAGAKATAKAAAAGPRSSGAGVPAAEFAPAGPAMRAL